MMCPHSPEVGYPALPSPWEPYSGVVPVPRPLLPLSLHEGDAAVGTSSLGIGHITAWNPPCFGSAMALPWLGEGCAPWILRAEQADCG